MRPVKPPCFIVLWNFGTNFLIISVLILLYVSSDRKFKISDDIFRSYENIYTKLVTTPFGPSFKRYGFIRGKISLVWKKKKV